VYQSVPNRTQEEVREEFLRNGLAIADWARAHGFSAQLVYQVLAGRKRCTRGKSHEIAVRLGLKAGQIGSVASIGRPFTPTDSGVEPASSQESTP
jgi:gp16 family phage-associated protein